MVKMECKTYEMGLINGKLGFKPVDNSKFTELRRGQVLHWQGPYSRKYVILDKMASEYGLSYNCIALKAYESEDDYKPNFHRIQSHSIVAGNEPGLWHTQHHYLTEETLPEEELKRLEQEAAAIRQAELKAGEEAEARQEANRAKRTEGKRLIAIRLCYDDSDSMTDYYSPCASIKEWILAEIPQGRRDLKLLHKEIAKYPALSALKWEEHRENYSMNHFGYSLTSETVKVADYITEEKTIKGYDGRTREHGFLMVQFRGDAGSDDWPQKPTTSTTTENKQITASDKATISINGEKKGIEIRFPARPDATTLDKLKSSGWRWSRFNVCWYKRQSPEAEAEAKEITRVA